MKWSIVIWTRLLSRFSKVDGLGHQVQLHAVANQRCGESAADQSRARIRSVPCTEGKEIPTDIRCATSGSMFRLAYCTRGVLKL